MLGTADYAECGNRRVISRCHILAEKNFYVRRKVQMSLSWQTWNLWLVE